MKRINVYENDVYQGWFNSESANEIASYQHGDPYTSGKILLRTANGKLIVNHWNNTGSDYYRYADDEAEIAEILSRGGYDGDDEKLNAVLSEYEF